MHIKWTNHYGYRYFRLNTSKYSAIPSEKEILLQDGAKFTLEDVVTDHQVVDEHG